MRTGRLVLCTCEHTLAHHDPRPAWYGAPPDQLEHGCYFCECSEYREAPPERQEKSVRLRSSEYVAHRESLGLPRMRCGTISEEKE